MRIGSLFSGIGGLELGLEWAGVGHTVWQVERDPFCRQVLAKHWPDAERFNDVREVGAHNLQPVDVICGGYPCQPFSIARTLAVGGERTGSDDPRALWPEFARIIRELRPKFAVLENVRAHLSLGFGDVLGDLAELGYDAEWSVLRGTDAGIPQVRQRVFIIAIDASLGIREVPDSVAFDASRHYPWPDVSRTGPTNIDYQSDGPRPVSLLGDGSWPEIPDGERSGTGDGIPLRLDRYHALGNAVIPQVAQIVGQRLIQLAGLDKRTPSPHIPSTP